MHGFGRDCLNCSGSAHSLRMCQDHVFNYVIYGDRFCSTHNFHYFTATMDLRPLLTPITLLDLFLIFFFSQILDAAFAGRLKIQREFVSPYIYPCVGTFTSPPIDTR